MTSYSINIPVYTSWNDTIKFEISSKGYILLHFSESDGINRADTTFLKYKTFLDSIEFLNSDWLKQEKNLIEFWDKSLYENGGHLDTLKIFIIQPIKGTDSLRIEQVHRFFMPNREG
jgi:hypothetical protein